MDPDQNVPADRSPIGQGARIGHAMRGIDTTLRCLPRALWLDLLRDDQTRRWIGGQRISAHDYFALLPELRDDSEESMVLICGELLLRAELGEHLELSDYQRAYPEFADELDRQFQINREILPTAVVSPIVDDTWVDPPPGYRLLRVLGYGASSIVYLAWQISVGREVAIKVMHDGEQDSRVGSPERSEVQILASLQHPHVVQIFEVIREGGTCYLVMEYVGGVTLAHSIAARPFQSRDAAGMLQTLATTLHTIHQRGIAHCDLKPSNVLCTELGELKITDFGLARRSADDHDVTIGTLLGTPNYMAPELIGGLSSTGVSCDIYSLGVILYELLTGTPPYHGISILDTLRCVLEQPIPSPRKRRSDIPADLEMICQKCLSRNPQQRYLSAGDLAQDLQRFRDGRSVSARPVGVFRQFGRHMARQPIACLLGALLCLTACYGLIAVTWERHLNRTAVRQVEEERGRSAELGREADRAQHQAELHRRELERRHVRLRSAVEQIDRGRQAMLQMHWDQALHAFSLAHDRVPELATALEERGNLYLTLHLYERAGEDLRAAYALHQPAEHTRWMRDAPLFMLLQDKLGFDAVSATIRRNRFHPADYMRITTLASSNEPDLAAWTHAVLQTSQEANTSPQHAHALARAFLRLGQNSDAILVCDQLLNGDWAERGSVYPTLAVAQYRLRQYEAAEDAMQAAQARYQVWTKQFLQPPDDRWIIHQNVQPHWPVSSDTWFEFLVHYREACDELNWTPQVTASRHLLRARGLAGLRRPAEAIVEYELAREIAPDDPQVLLELHRSRAFQYVTQIRFAAAAKQYAAAAEFSPHDSHLLNFLAYAYLASFRMADYQATCEGMAVQWRDSQDTQDLLKLCDACANHPDAVEDWPALERVARRFEPMLRPVSTRSCARILYRVGKHQEAIELLEQLERTEPLRGTDFCFLALANHALDRSDQSRRRLTQAVTWMVDGNPPEGAWTDRIQTLVMYREAIAKVPRDLSLNTSER